MSGAQEGMTQNKGPDGEHWVDPSGLRRVSDNAGIDLTREENNNELSVSKIWAPYPSLTPTNDCGQMN
jgi:hypothetical protein